MSEIKTLDDLVGFANRMKEYRLNILLLKLPKDTFHYNSGIIETCNLFLEKLKELKANLEKKNV